MTVAKQSRGRLGAALLLGLALLVTACGGGGASGTGGGDTPGGPAGGPPADGGAGAGGAVVSDDVLEAFMYNIEDKAVDDDVIPLLHRVEYTYTVGDGETYTGRFERTGAKEQVDGVDTEIVTVYLEDPWGTIDREAWLEDIDWPVTVMKATEGGAEASEQGTAIAISDTLWPFMRFQVDYRGVLLFGQGHVAEHTAEEGQVLGMDATIHTVHIVGEWQEWEGIDIKAVVADFGPFEWLLSAEETGPDHHKVFNSELTALESR